MNFSLNQIRYFLALAQEKHFAKAASRSFISQPTLSAAIKKLEQQLDVKLFERGHRQQVYLTQEGEALVIQARHLLDSAEAFQDLSRSQVNHFHQRFHLGVIYSVAPYLLPSLIPALKNKAPNMPLLIEENYTHNLKLQLQQGKIDAAIIALPFDDIGIEYLPLYKEPFCLVTYPSHALMNTKKNARVKRSQINEKELLVLGPGHCFRDQVLAACPHCVTKNNEANLFSGSSLETIMQMVASGAGISIIPERCARNHAHNPMLRIMQLDKPVPNREIALAWRKSSNKKPVMSLIAQLDYSLS